MLQDLIGRCKEMIAQESGDDTAEKEVEAVQGKIKELLRRSKSKIRKRSRNTEEKNNASRKLFIFWLNECTTTTI